MLGGLSNIAKCVQRNTNINFKLLNIHMEKDNSLNYLIKVKKKKSKK